MGIVDAFAGAAESLKTWENMLKSTTQAPFGEMTYEKYLSHLLSDYVPIYFDFKIKDPKSKTPTVHRILFANNASLLAKRKGMVDNSDRFGKIEVAQLEQWSKDLVKPLIQGTMKLISGYKPELEAVSKWSGFESLINEAEQLLKESNMEKLYTILMNLAQQTWGLPTALAEVQQQIKAGVMPAQQIKDEQQMGGNAKNQEIIYLMPGKWLRMLRTETVRAFQSHPNSQDGPSGRNFSKPTRN